LDSLDTSGLSPYILELKEGGSMAVFEELNQEQGLHNGIKLILHKMCDNFLDLQIATDVNVD